jgi:hypothetical protein
VVRDWPLVSDPIRWDASLGRFRNSRGQLISAVQVRAELDKSLVASANRAKALGAELRSGRMSLVAWRLEMRAIVKDVNLRSAALAKGGWNQMGHADFGAVGAIVKKEYQFLEQWTEEIKGGLPLDGRLNTRSALYAAAGRTTFHQVQSEEMDKLGFTEESNQLHPADHCNGPDSCQEQTDRGWVAIRTLLIPGTRICGRNCRCSLAYR